MSNYLMDTDIVIEYLKNNKNVVNRLLQANINGEKVFINGIVYYEIKRGLLPSQSAKFGSLQNANMIIWLDKQNIFDEASIIYANLKQNNQLIGDADILIAATAKVNNLVVVTNNLKHFRRINGIQIDNWI